MASIVRKSPQARRDLDHIVAYLTQYSPSAARRFLLQTEQKFNLIATQPDIGEAYASSSHPDRRVTSVGGRFRMYTIYFEPIDEGIVVVRVLHGARDVARELD